MMLDDLIFRLTTVRKSLGVNCRVYVWHSGEDRPLLECAVFFDDPNRASERDRVVLIGAAKPAASSITIGGSVKDTVIVTG